MRLKHPKNSDVTIMSSLRANLVRDVAMSGQPLNTRGAITIVGDNQETLPMDLLLVLDVSPSMSGAGIKVLQESVVHTLDHLLRPEDKYAIITFDSSARVHTNWSNKSNDPSGLGVKGGGTNFGAAINETLSLLGSHGKDPSRAGIILFLSDGQASMPKHDSVSTITEFGFTMHTLGLTSGAVPEHLEAMAELARGFYFDCPSFNDVKKAFGSLFNYGKTVTYASPDLRVNVSSGVAISDLTQSPQGIEIHAGELGPGNHTVSLTHMVKDSRMEVSFKVKVDHVSDGDNLLASFDCIGGSAELKVRGTTDKTELINAPINGDVTLITKTAQVARLLKTGNTAEANKVITQIRTLEKTNPNAGDVSKTMTDLTKTKSPGEMLEGLGRLQSDEDGKTKKRED